MERAPDIDFAEELVLAASCENGVCAEADPSKDELTDQQEVRFRSLETAAFRWSEALGQARSDAALAIDHLNTGMLSMQRIYGTQTDPQWSLPKKLVRGSKSDVMATVRLDAIGDIREHAADVLGDTTVEATLHGSDTQKITQLQDHLCQRLQAMPAGYHEAQDYPHYIFINLSREKLANPYLRVYVSELVARAELALAMADMPEVIQSMMKPDQLKQMPNHLRNLFINDLGAEKQSLLLAFVKKPQQGPTKISFFEYLQDNNLSASARELAKAVSLGAGALGACNCPSNSVGLCKEAADAIQISQLPKDIQSDIAKKQQAAETYQLSQLKQLAQQVNVSNWWSFHSNIHPQIKKAGTNSSKRSAPSPHTPSFRALEQSAEKAITSETSLPDRLKVSFVGSADTHEVECSDASSIETLLDTLLQANEVQKYVQAHRERADLGLLVRAGLERILTAVNYRDEPSLLVMSNIAPHTTADGQKLTVWRMSGVSGGKIGRDTRIYFGVSNKGGTRRIEILRIAHKSDVVKQVRRTAHLIKSQSAQ